MKKLSHVFAALAVILSNVMCAAVAYEYGYLTACMACSAPASVAFLLAIPFAVAIAVCAVLALVFRKK